MSTGTVNSPIPTMISGRISDPVRTATADLITIHGPGVVLQPAYTSININLWVFIAGANFGQDNYADFNLGPDYTRYAFEQRTVRISNRPMERGVLESITRQPIQQAPVEVRELRTNQRTIKVIVPSGTASAERLRVAESRGRPTGHRPGHSRKNKNSLRGTIPRSRHPSPGSSARRTSNPALKPVPASR